MSANTKVEPGPHDTAAILAADARHRSGLWEPDVVYVRGEGVRLYDADGREYLDCMAGIAVASLGHGNERLAAALADQARKLIVAPQNVANDTRTRFVTKLFEFVEPPLERVFLSNSGAEANEAAIKWARVATGRNRFVALRNGFSGRSGGVLPLTWEPKYREPFGPYGAEVEFVNAGDEAALTAAMNDRTAALLLEPVQGESGIRPVPDSYLRLARRLSDEHGALLIFDEIQTGVGRTGTFLASQASGVHADIVTLAKGLGSGVPIGATLMTAAVAAAMPKGGHGTTFGGNPLAAAAGLVVLSELEERSLMQRATVLGARLMEGLARVGAGVVSEVRGRGLLIGVQMAVPAGPVIAALKDAGVLTIAGGGETIRFLPPLVIDEAEVDEVIRRSAAVFAAFA
ncbi:MAG: aminotransferase class III-fold pyridoxal phosphate-dependent enzyme [Trueperaceae bacterium]